MKLSFKSNTYNSLDKILQDDQPMEFIWVVECRSTLFFNEVTKKNKLNILLSTLQKRQVEEIEESVNVHYKHLGFTSSLRKDVLIDSNIPTTPHFSLRIT